MRLLSLTAFLAVPLVLIIPEPANANPLESRGFGCGGVCLGWFPNIHQHGPLFNYGPYYGYYPFKPYGPWDEYLRYDPFFYGDPYANWKATPDGSNMYGWNQKLPHLRGIGIHVPHLLHHSHHFHHFHHCKSCGFSHASWKHGGWFHGHTWLHGNCHHCSKPACKSCGGVAVVTPSEPGDAVARYSGIGNPAQSVVFYSATPTLDPTLELAADTEEVK